MANKNTVFDRHTFTDESMTGNLAAFADARIFLYLDKCTDFRLIPDLAAVKIDELRERNFPAESHIRRDAKVRTHRCTNAPLLFRDSFAAWSILTTLRPAAPSLKGASLFVMQSTKYPNSRRSASPCSICGAHISPER